VDAFKKAGLKASGVNPDTGLVEIVEIEDHHWCAIPSRI
jgi:CTP synthase